MSEDLELEEFIESVQEKLDAFDATELPKKPKKVRDPKKLKEYQAKWRAKKKKAAKKAKLAMPRAKATRTSKPHPKSRKPALSKSGPKERFLRGGLLRTGNFIWGKKVAKARQSKGLTQEELAIAVGIKQPHMCNCERGTFSASKALKARIEAKLGITRPSRAKPKPETAPE